MYNGTTKFSDLYFIGVNKGVSVLKVTDKTASTSYIKKPHIHTDLIQHSASIL